MISIGNNFAFDELRRLALTLHSVPDPASRPKNAIVSIGRVT